MSREGTQVNKTSVSVNKTEHSQGCDCTNRVCTHNTTDVERADHLLEVVDFLKEGGKPDVRLMPLKQDERGPVIRGRCKLDSDEARSLLVTPEEAARRIREDDVRGFYLYCGKESHGTDGLVILDRDEPDLWPDTSDTLRVVSGSGSSDHLYYHNDGSVENAKAKDDLKGAGSVQAENWGVVAPGSIHHECDGIYHVAENPGISTLSSSDLPPSLRPSGVTSGSGTHTYQGLTEPDEDAVKTVQEAIVNFRRNSDSTWRAIEYFEDLRAGNDLREHGFIPDDSSNMKGCRHEANLTLATLLYGMLLLKGEYDQDRNRRLIHEYLSHIAHQYPRTSCGQRRKLLLSDDYIKDRVNVAVENFDHNAFTKWMKKTPENNYHGDYSGITQQMVLEATERLAEEDGPYPTKADIVELCPQLDTNPRSKGTYGKCLRKMAGRQLHQAKLGHNDYRYYPLGMNHPEDAVEIKGTWL